MHNHTTTRRRTIALLGLLSLFTCACAPEKSPTPETTQHSSAPALTLWNEGNPKTALLDFVDSVTNQASSHYLAPAERIAVFDMDGTILIEKPTYVLFGFALQRMQAQIDERPILAKHKQPYKAIATGDMDYFHHNTYGTDGLYDVLLYATDGLNDTTYRTALQQYLATPHSRFNVAPNTLVYAPIIELIDHLHAHQFKVYIVSGSDPEFTRIATADTVDIPPERIIGTTILTKWDGTHFTRQHEFVRPINDEAGKPVNIRNHIGRIPVLAVGNSRGDLEMLNYSKRAPHSLQLIVNHDDPEREYEYAVEKMQQLCKQHDWIEISMQRDFKTIFSNTQ